MTNMKQWFNNLRPHEQWMLLLTGILLVSYLLYALAWQPLKASQTSLAQKNTLASATLREVKRLSQEYLALKASGNSAKAASGGSLASIVDSSVAKNQLTMSRFQPSASGDAQVRFENAGFDAVLAWLHQIETEHGIAVRDLSISKGSATGLVNVSVRVGKG